MPPKASLKPSHLVSTWHRWSTVAQELAGKKTRQQLMQVGTIGLVVLLRTLLQVCGPPPGIHCNVPAGSLWVVFCVLAHYGGCVCLYRRHLASFV